MGCLPSSPSKPSLVSLKESDIILNTYDLRALLLDSLDIAEIRIEFRDLSCQGVNYAQEFTQIDRDAARSFPNEPYFKKEENLTRLANLLKQFVVHLPLLGYTQGMNFLCGYLMLSCLDDEMCLKCLVKLHTHHSLIFIGLYQDEFPLCFLLCKIFWAILGKKSPSLKKYIREDGITDHSWLFQWFMTHFILCFPFSYIRPFFALTLHKKRFSMVRIAVAVVLMLEKSILHSDMCQLCFNRLRDLAFCQKVIPINKVLEKACEISEEDIEAALQTVTTFETFTEKWYLDYFKSDKQSMKKMHQQLISSQVVKESYYVSVFESKTSTKREISNFLPSRKSLKSNEILLQVFGE